MIQSDIAQSADTANLLSPEPQSLTEQEIEHMEALADVLYEIFAREQNGKHESVLSLDTVLTSPRVFAPASTAVN